MQTATDVLNAARSELGTKEGPGENQTEYAAEAGHANGQPWCATFVVAMCRRAKLKLPSESAYTPTMYSALKKAGRAIDGPKVGALAFLYFPKMGRIAHVGIVEALRPDGRFVTIEGNTDVAGGRTGGQVMRKVRSRSNWYFAMPSYVAASKPKPPAKPPTKPPASGAVPRFPLPRGYYFGPKNGPKESVSGYFSHREDLRLWQSRMIRRGWNFGPSGADGLWGASTERVVVLFQKEKRIPATGRIKEDTWRAAWTAPKT